MESFAINALGASLLASTYYYVYVTLQTPAGILVDRFGPRLLLALGALVCGIGCLIFSTAQQLPIAIVGRLLMGICGAFAFVGSLSLIARWFPVSRFAVMVAVAETIGMCGALFGGTLLAHLVIHFGWRHCILGAAISAGLIFSHALDHCQEFSGGYCTSANASHQFLERCPDIDKKSKSLGQWCLFRSDVFSGNCIYRIVGGSIYANRPPCFFNHGGLYL